MIVGGTKRQNGHPVKDPLNDRRLLAGNHDQAVVVV